MSNFMNIRPEGPSFFVLTDMTKLKVALRNFANVSKNHSQFKEIILSVWCINFRGILVTNGNRG